jgi:hypothetical protein
MERIMPKKAEFASEPRTVVSKEEAFLPTGSTAISRRKVMALGMTGVAWLLFPYKKVLGQNLMTLGGKLSLELEQMDTEYRGRGIPEQVRSQLEATFKSDITDVVLSNLSIASDASSAELSQIKSSLDDGAFRLGTLTRDWISGVLQPDNIVGVLRQNESIRATLDLPSFQLPFTPDYGFNLGATKPSTTQTPLEFLQALRANVPPFDPRKVKLSLDPFDFQAPSENDNLRLILQRVTAEKFWDGNYKFDPERLEALAKLHCDLNQNGSRLPFEVFLEAKGGFPGGPYTVVGGVTFNVP